MYGIKFLKSLVNIIKYDDFLYHLKCKLVEEENEVLCAKDHENLVEELTDLLEVVECLLETTDISLSLVKQKQALKKEEKGSFNQRIYLKSIE